MLELGPNRLLVQTVDELPNLIGCEDVYIDFETRSGFAHRGGDSPYHGDRICGVAITADDLPDAWYIPIRHNDKDWNLPVKDVISWLSRVIFASKRWINHNIKFDAHFARVEGIDTSIQSDSWEDNCRDLVMVDTMTMAKMVDSDRMGFGLKMLCREWLDMDMSGEEKRIAFMRDAKTKDFADVPADIMGEYACEDVLGCRNLWKYEEKILQEDEALWEVSNTEIKVTSVLFDMECFGMPVVMSDLQKKAVVCLHKIVQYEEELAELTGHEINAKSPSQVSDLLLQEFGLPILGYTKERDEVDSEEELNPSFSKDILKKYMVHPLVLADPKIKRSVELIRDIRDERNFYGMFLEPYMRLQVDGFLHPQFNQCVRTGRMSSKNPNAQQLNKRAKALVHPPKDWAFLCCDYSQIEFRIIIHYIEDQVAIKAYNENPNTDFHTWVSEIVHTQRKPAKTINFMMAFGGGKKKTIVALSGNPDVILEVSEKVNEIFSQGEQEILSHCSDVDLVSRWDGNLVVAVGDQILPYSQVSQDQLRVLLFDKMCEKHSLNVYATYHEQLPTLKTTMWQAADVCKKKGYVRNHYGRRRTLPSKASYKAFNAVIQSSAADVMKERLVAVSPRFNDEIREKGIKIFAVVHDEIAFCAPRNVLRNVATQSEIREILESPSRPFLVPITTGMGFSINDWAQASDDELEKLFNEKGDLVAGGIPRHETCNENASMV